MLLCGEFADPLVSNGKMSWYPVAPRAEKWLQPKIPLSDEKTVAQWQGEENKSPAPQVN